MRLLDLEPAIYKFNGITAGFYFWCPCPKCINDPIKRCRLSCKRLVISVRDQMYIFMDIWGPGHQPIVPCKADMCWKFTGTSFADMTVHPSLDASASGNWHGFIQNGMIIG